MKRERANTKERRKYINRRLRGDGQKGEKQRERKRKKGGGKQMKRGRETNGSEERNK